MKAVRRITPAKKEELRKLTNILYEFLPLTSRVPSAVTFKSIFSESKIENYLDVQGNKRQVLNHGLENLFRYHKNLPRIVIRKVLNGGIDYRLNYKRLPITVAEIESLIAALGNLQINMARELRQVNLPTEVPTIEVPPLELKRRLENHPLTTVINSEPKELFNNGHYNEAVRKATEKLEVLIQNKSGLTSIGVTLMSNALQLPTPPLAINSLSSENERGIQEGFKFLCMGIIRAIRNIFSHGDEDQRRAEEAYEMLIFINWISRQIE